MGHFCYPRFHQEKCPKLNTKFAQCQNLTKFKHKHDPFCPKIDHFLSQWSKKSILEHITPPLLQILSQKKCPKLAIFVPFFLVGHTFVPSNFSSSPPSRNTLDRPTNEADILDISIKGKEIKMVPTETEEACANIRARFYKRLADKNINVMSCSVIDGEAVVILEYCYERPRDGKIIWPKIAVEGSDIYDAATMAELVIDKIREED